MMRPRHFLFRHGSRSLKAEDYFPGNMRVVCETASNDLDEVWVVGNIDTAFHCAGHAASVTSGRYGLQRSRVRK